MTSARRRKWIEGSKPSSVELVEVFPFLRVEKWVRNIGDYYELQMLSGWPLPMSTLGGYSGTDLRSLWGLKINPTFMDTELW